MALDRAGRVTRVMTICVCAGLAVAAPAVAVGRVSAVEKGSLLVFPTVELRWNAADGVLVQDTFVDLINDYPEQVTIQMYFVHGDPALPEMPPERAHPGCVWIDNNITLTANEPTYWSVWSGNPKGVTPWWVLDPGDPPGRPDPENPSQRILRGYILAWAVNHDGEEIRWNHLTGHAYFVNYAEGTAWKYTAYAASGTDAVAHGDPLPGTPGELLLDGTEYDGCFDSLLLDFYAVDSTALSRPGGAVQVTADTDLTLLPMTLDLRQDNNGPPTTKAEFAVWNMNEVKFTNMRRCITCWDQALLGDYDPPNHTLLANLQTDVGKARIDGVASNQCDVGGATSIDTPLVGVAAKVLDFGGLATSISGDALVGSGLQNGKIEVDVWSSDPPTRRPYRPVADGFVVSDDPAPVPPGTLGIEGRTSWNKGSFLAFPAVEIRWDSTGTLVQDTFVSLTNDVQDGVKIQLYFVDGDNWNFQDITTQLTQDQPTYWSAATGLPGPAGGGVPPFTILGPGHLDPGSGDTVLRGFILAWAINDAGQEIRWNHLKGGALTVHYGNGASWQYEALAFRGTEAVEHGMPLPGIPGEIKLDGVKYDQCFDQLLMDFYAVGSDAHSHPDGAIDTMVDTDLTLLPMDIDLRPIGAAPTTTVAEFDVWNENEIKFTGMRRCITGWDQALLSTYSHPNHFLLPNIQTDFGKARINGIATAPCDDSVRTPLLGVSVTLLEFESAGGAPAMGGATLVGMGMETGVVGSVRDCNTNGVPDLQDIVDGTSDDCNGNGTPDECERGACCIPPADCADNQTEEGCLAAGGVFRGPCAECPAQSVVIIQEPGGDVFVHSIGPPVGCPPPPGEPRAQLPDCPVPPASFIDPWVSPVDPSQSTMCHHFGVPGSPAIPADFFGQGSDPFIGIVCLQGLPLGPTPWGHFGDADTLIARTLDPFDKCDLPSQNEATVPIEIMALSLQGVEPITVTFNGGQNPQQWDVTLVDLSEVAPPPGTLSAVKSHCNGGTYTSVLDVQPRFTLAKVGDPGQMLVLDTGLTGVAPIQLVQSDPAPWVSLIDPNLGVDGDPCSDFHAGTEDPQPTFACDCNTNQINDVCEADCNSNGIPDDCDVRDCPAGELACADCNTNGVPDGCELAGNDCNSTGVPDDCELAGNDCDSNGMPDECAPDCNSNGVPDACDLAGGASADCNSNAVPDECEPDGDGDGLIDECDACPSSDLRSTIVIDGCNSEVANVLDGDGCTMLDHIAQCAADARNHGAFVSCVAHLTNEWKRAGLISGAEKGRIQSCAAHADIPHRTRNPAPAGGTDSL